MKIGIAFKLFCALLGAGIVMATAMGVASRISFQRGFLGYLNDLETQRLAVLTATLAEVYEDHGDWTFLRGEEDEWRRIVRASDRSFRQARDAGQSGAAPAANDAANASVPRGADPADAAPAGAPAAPGAAASGSTSAGTGGVTRTSRTTLLDAGRQVIAGDPTPSPDARYGAVQVGGRTVGWVASPPYRELTNAADLSFQQKQNAAAWYIAALAVLLAGIVAWALGRIFLAPARRLAAATHLLAAGRFDTRVPVESSDELGRLAVDFNRLATTLERNENLRRAFMADVSHELRTPLAIMRGELEAMEDGLQPLDRDSVRSLQAEVAALSKLVEDIHQLAIAEVGALSYDRVEFDVAAQLARSVDGWRERLAGHGIAVEMRLPPAPLVVTGDPDRLAQVFGNLLENALRYAGEGARVRATARPDGAFARVVVEDSGPGVPDEMLEPLFDRFYRMEGSRNRATGGSGLGLAICRSIVEAHAGTLAASRSPLGGLAMTLSLPAAATTVPAKTGILGSL
ncbi:MAG: HAMP domain-containing protein [Burkholderiaceae bacterium]|nr:HAMP domain-containing protein [Burkholderiaceae bacterium]